MTSAVPPFSTATATAPPARHTKSAEWAPMTWTLRLMRQAYRSFAAGFPMRLATISRVD